MAIADMTPTVRTGLRRIATVVLGMGQASIAYMLHAFTGWQWWAMLGVALRLVMAEGAERERARQGRNDAM
jgi:uncharacterized membrane protein YgaE (UPF0421/DUF939 family)